MEHTNIDYKLEVDYQHTADYLQFTTNGIIIPKFLSNHIVGRKKQFFFDNKVLTYTDTDYNSYFLRFSNICSVEINKSKNRNYEIKFIGKVESKNYIIIHLSKITEKQFLKIYEIIQKKSHMGVPLLKDIEFSAQMALEGQVIKILTVMAITAIASFLMSFELIGGIPKRYNYLSIIALSFSGGFFLSLLGVLVWFSSLNSKIKTKKRIKQITCILIISEIFFLIIMGFVFIFGFTR